MSSTLNEPLECLFEASLSYRKLADNSIFLGRNIVANNDSF